MFNYFTAVDGLICVKTNMKSFSWSYGVCMPVCSSEEYAAARIKIEINVEGGNLWDAESDKQFEGKFHYFSGNHGEKIIRYDRSFFFKQRLQYSLEGVESDQIRIRVNKNYLRYVKHRFMNVHSLGYIVTDIVNLRLCDNGFAPLHCSAVSLGEESYVIFAPPNTGKTLTAMNLCMEKSYDFVAEDLAITDGKNIYAVPWTSTFRYYDSVDKSISSNWINWITERIAIFELFGFGKVEPITQYVDADRIKAISEAKRLYILERGEESINSIDKETAFRMCHTLDRYEFNYMRAPAIIVYQYFNPEIEVQRTQKKEEEILELLMDSVDTIDLVSSRNALNYMDMIDQHIKSN